MAYIIHEGPFRPPGGYRELTVTPHAELVEFLKHNRCPQLDVAFVPEDPDEEAAWFFRRLLNAVQIKDNMGRYARILLLVRIRMAAIDKLLDIITGHFPSILREGRVFLAVMKPGDDERRSLDEAIGSAIPYNWRTFLPSSDWR